MKGGVHLERILCDEMLKGLGRWLRAAGYDTAIAEDGQPDEELVRQARDEGRLLLTRDRHLAEFWGLGDGVLVLRANGLDAQVRELMRRTDVDWLRQPLSRCLLCNTRLRPARPEEFARVPPQARSRASEAWVCPRCQKVYWYGSHVPRILRRLRCWQSWRDQA